MPSCLCKSLCVVIFSVVAIKGRVRCGLGRPSAKLFECFLPVGDHESFHESARGCRHFFWPRSLARSAARRSSMLQMANQSSFTTAASLELASGLDDLAHLVVQRLDGVGRVDHPAHLRRECQEGNELLPHPVKALVTLVLHAQLGRGERIELGASRFGVRRRRPA